MVTQIIDDTSCIRLIFDGNVYLVNKAWIRSIETVQNDTVKIDVAAGTLKHLYIKLSEVSLPAGLADVFALRDAIKAMLDSAVNTSQIPVSLTTALNALEKSLAASANAINVNTPAITDESVPNVIYYGYASNGGFTNQPTWAIMQVSRINNIVTNEWANGGMAFNNIWDNRYALRYASINNPMA